MALVESKEERRERFLRLAQAAASTAAKMPLANLRLKYLQLSENLKSAADEISTGGKLV
jgi:hypothetical protein